jgi:hypothetical protein
MEDVEFNKSHSNSPLPEAGNDPADPLRPEIDEENSVPNPTNATTYQDTEVTEDKAEMPDPDDIEAGLSDNESVLSEAMDDDQFDEQFGEFDASNIAIEERAIDEDTVKQIGVYKRKRAEGEGDEPKKKKKRADKPRRKKNKGDDEGEGIPDGSRKSKRSKKEVKVRGASPDEEAEENLTPEERTCDSIFVLSNANMHVQAGSVRSTARWTPLSRAAQRAAARRTALTSNRWPTRRLRTCVAAWHRLLKPTTRAGSVANPRATSSSSCQKSLPCSTRATSRSLS